MAEVGLGHNHSDFSQRAVLFVLLGQLAEANAAIEEAKQEQKEILKKGKNLGFSKRDLDIGLKLQAGDEKIPEQYSRAAEIARLVYRPFNTQLDLPLEGNDAYLRGHEVGLTGAPAVSNYAPGTPEFGEFQKGVADGNKARNEALLEMTRREEESEGDDDSVSDDFDTLEDDGNENEED